MGIPDKQHLRIEAALRGMTQLLPSEGYSDWQIIESRKGQAPTTKILRLEKECKPTLAFDREGEKIHFWAKRDSYDWDALDFEEPELMQNEQSPYGNKNNNGSHSNMWSFFNGPEYLWRQRLQNMDEVWKLIEAI